MLHTTKFGDKVFCESSYQHLWKKSLQEDMLHTFGQGAYDHEEHAIFQTESDDHETYEDLFLKPRKGLEDIKRYRFGREQALHGKMTRRRPRKDEKPEPARKSYDFEDEDMFRFSLYDEEPSTVGEEFIEPYALTEYIECKDDCTRCQNADCINGQIDYDKSQEWILNR